MKDLHAIRGRYYIQRLIDQGEHERQDFKFAISDARKIARSLSAFANNSGGALLIGVKDNGVIAGIRTEEDVYLVEQAAQMYCEPAQEISFQAYRTDPGVTVVRAVIAAAARRPVFVREADNALRAYYRVADENIAAHPLLVSAWAIAADPNGSGLLLSLTDTESRLIDLLSHPAPDTATEEPGIDPARIPTLLHISTADANRLMSRLIAIDILTLRYHNHHWRLCLC